MIIYAYRDAIDGLQEILDENTPAEPEQRQTLVRLCERYLDRFGDSDEDDYDEDEYDEDEEGMECVDDRGY